MATDLENLATIKSNYLAALAADSTNPKKSYSIDGQSVNRDAWRESLFKRIAEIDELLTSAQGPFEVEA